MLVGWSKFEKLLLVLATIVMAALSIYWGDSWIGITSSITGIVSVILTAKCSRYCYIFGLVNNIFYMTVAYNENFYGEVMLNGLYYLPMQFIGWILWSKSIQESGYVQPRRLSKKFQIVLVVVSVVLVYGYGVFLDKIGGNLPYIDSMSTVLSVIAMYLAVRRYMEQWMIWILVNIVSIIMWGIALLEGANDIATLVMWSVYLVNAIYGYVKWDKESKVNV